MDVKSIITYMHNIVLALLISPGQNDRHSADNIFRCIFVNEKFCVLIKISQKFFPKGPINNMLEFVQIMAWCRTGDKPLPEPMLTHFTHPYICDIRERWVKPHISQWVTNDEFSGFE